MSDFIARVLKRRHKEVKVNDGADSVYLRAVTGKELKELESLPLDQQDAAYIALAMVDDQGKPVCPVRDGESLAEFAKRSWVEFTSEIPIDTRMELLEALGKLQRPPSQRALEKN